MTLLNAKVKLLVIAIGITLSYYSYANQESNIESGEQVTVIKTNSGNNTALTSFHQALLSDNEKQFNLVTEIKGRHGAIDITLYRFEPQSETNLNQMHSSFILNQEGGLEGFVRLLPEYSADKAQVSKKEAEDIALTFLNKYATDIVADNKVNWVDAHDEQIVIEGNTVPIKGMKVKYRNKKDGFYSWVVVAPDKSVMIFERNIEWDFLRSGRKTELWLHDSWLMENV